MEEFEYTLENEQQFWDGMFNTSIMTLPHFIEASHNL
jgi:hypothetical protein